MKVTEADNYDLGEVLMLSEQFSATKPARMTSQELDAHLLESQIAHSANLEKYYEERPELLKHDYSIDFATAIQMYNLGIKDRKLQTSTLQTIKYLDHMKEELTDILVANAVDKQQRDDLRDPTTRHFLHKNYMVMRALYNRSEQTTERKLPEILRQDVEIEIGRAPVNQAEFTSKYDKLKENTKL